jgi:hypothetical protein
VPLPTSFLYIHPVYDVLQGMRFAESMLVEGAGVAAIGQVAMLMGLRGLAAGGAARAIFGKSFALSTLLGAGVGLCAATAAIVTILSTPADLTAAEINELFAYPLGVGPTLEAVASGAMCMAALVMLAVGMSSHARRARIGVVLGLAIAGLAFGGAALGCALFGWCVARTD